MKAVIPAAGQGTRLYPQTHTKPKAMVRLAGEPILGHILSNLTKTSVHQVVIVVGGPMQNQIIEYAETSFNDEFEINFVEQETAEGLGHSIYQTEAAVRGDSALIALGDMLFENGYGTFLDAHNSLDEPDASIGVKTVEEPRHYGVAELAESGQVERVVEKPEEPRSNYAISGVYIVENTDLLFDALAHLVENNIRGAGYEYQLTDALQHMIQSDACIDIFEVEDWYDCGRPETLLEANRVLLSKGETNGADSLDNAVVIPPVDFGDNVVVKEGIVGPNVSVDNDVRITDSIVRNGIVGENATLESVHLEGSIVGNGATVRSEANQLNVGDNSIIEL
ncbi:dTDP-glucose pyrophosphorylase [Halanaeroarchaeum sp. HSR-CO]|uniref:sugar phosphate nucleotidyltransferase n=1 Tax=Halanaeroarchaeum sp. HSR-CO TaxID=2866382 RepID=UPI00217EE9EE|nr:sugar phosphate nucleotidyltransferase [Halanaeroarchaeum sp. HSR-CO]UWG48125.1 dTDP-glucose pyrophosphorylase [Halanaeroarchaeum sp. HSR-CO]